MSQSESKFAPDAERRVNEFLAAVDRALSTGGCSQSERQNVADDLKAQIGQMLADRGPQSNEPATLADVEAVLAELDPPEAYASPEEEPPGGAGAQAAGGSAPHPRGEFAFGPGGPGRRCGPHGRRGWWHKWRRRSDIAAAVRGALSRGDPFAIPPFSGFGERSRRVVAHAKNEARQWRHNYIGTEHLLIGIALEQEGLGAIILKSLGFDANRLREEVAKQIREGPEPVTADLLPITPRSQRSFRAAARAAHSLGSQLIDTEHLLLGLVAVPDGLAARVLIECGVPLDKIQREVLRAAGPRGAPDRATGALVFWPAGSAKTVALAGERYKLVAGGDETGGSHALIELLSPPGSAGLPTRSMSRGDLAVYVLHGSLRVTAGNRTLDAAAGGFVNVPRGTPHAIRNPGPEEARAMLVATPAGLDAFLAEVGAPASDAEPLPQPDPDELRRVLDAGPKYGVEFRVPD